MTEARTAANLTVIAPKLRKDLMSKWKALLGTATIAMACASAAHADLTALQVWEKWRAQSEAMGQTITGDTEVVGGDALRLTNVETVFTAPEGTIVGRIDLLEFRERPDGTVAITMSPRYELSGDMTSDGETARFVLALSHEGLSMIASGDDESITYDYLASSFSVTMESLEVEGAPEDLAVDVELAGIDGSYTVEGVEVPAFRGELAADSVDLAISGTDSETGDRIEISASYSDLTATSDSVLAMLESENTAAMLAAGFSFVSEVVHDAGGYTISVDEGEGATVITVKVDSGNYSTRLDQDGMAIGFGSSGLVASVAGPEIPFPELTLTAQATELGFALPVQANETPEDFAATLALEGVAVSDVLWQIFDPGQNLPRDPAAVVLALTGQARWFYDILDPDVQDAMPDGPPGELTALDLEELRLSIAGAELTGTGGFTFDNSDFETFEGMPRPQGSIDLRLVGGQTLLDKLVAMGLVPEDQAMNARMMLGLFARPGDGDDTLVSTIEVNEEGALIANGQRLQ